MYKNKILKFGRYTWSEINAKVATGYIPVANAEELDGIRNTNPKIMGVGSIWEGVYTTGLDKRYIQINNIDLSGFTNWVAIQTFRGVYDGNELFISNCTQGGNGIYSGLFGLCVEARFYNCIFNNFNIKGSNEENRLGAIAELTESGYAENCKCLGGLFSSETGGNGLGSLFGSINATIINCSSINTVVDCGATGDIHYVGGFIGIIRKDSRVQKCYVIGIVNNIYNSLEVATGGFVGYLETSTDSMIIDCWANVIVDGGRDVGGFVGWSGEVKLINCMSLGSVQGVDGVGGFCGTNVGEFDNCYYDVETSGQTDTGKGLPRKTEQMKQGTANSTVNGEGMYTDWSDAIWNFRTSLDYPKLRKI